MKTRNTIPAAFVVLGLIAMLGCDQKEERQKASGTRDQGREQVVKTGNPDLDFLTAATLANLADIEASRVAEARAASTEVKDFASRLVVDHLQFSQEMADLAAKKGFRLPNRPDDAHQKAIGRLGELSGVEFDRKYLGMMVTDHVRSVSLFEEGARMAKDEDIRDFADKSLPTLRGHLKSARDLSSKVGGLPSAD